MGGFGASEAETTREETETKSEDEEMVRPPHRSGGRVGWTKDSCLMPLADGFLSIFGLGHFCVYISGSLGRLE